MEGRLEGDGNPIGDMLKNRFAVITGSGNGLGRAEAIGMAAQGAKVVVDDLGTSHDGVGASSEPADPTESLLPAFVFNVSSADIG